MKIDGTKVNGFLTLLYLLYLVTHAAKVSAPFFFFFFYYNFFFLVSHLCMQIYASPPHVYNYSKKELQIKTFFCKFLAGIELTISATRI